MRHSTNGLPVKLLGQRQFGVCKNIEHSAPIPHAFWQGFWQRLLKHAVWIEQSLFVVHSGRQLGGDPIYSDKHEHVGLPLDEIHNELAPHGLGLHGSTGACGGGGITRL